MELLNIAIGGGYQERLFTLTRSGIERTMPSVFGLKAKFRDTWKRRKKKNREEENSMISKTFRITGMIVLASVALNSAARATCSDASLSGTYGFLHDGTDSNGAPATAAVTKITFDSATGTFAGETIASRNGVIATAPLTGTYTVASNCTGTGTPAGGSPFSIVVTSTGFLAVHPFAEGFAVQRGPPTCTNAAVMGGFGFEATGVFLAGAPAVGWVAFIGELQFTVNPSGVGVISGHVGGSEGDTTLAFAPVTGSYTVHKDCRGKATITPKGQPELNFSFVIVDGGKEMLAIETDADTVVSGTLQRTSWRALDPVPGNTPGAPVSQPSSGRE